MGINPELLILILGALAGIVLAAFFASSEMALISSDKVNLRKQRDLGGRRAALSLKHLENIDRLLTSTQFGANLSVAITTTCVTIINTRHLKNGSELYILLIFPLILVFSDILPKVVARHKADSIATFVAVPLAFFINIFAPITKAINIYTTKLSNAIGLGRLDSITRRKKMREELQALLQDTDNHSDIRLGHKRMIRKILEFSQQNVKKIMIPLVNVDAVPATTTVQEVIAIFESTRHSRLPVYEERIDNIVGVLHFQDIFTAADLEAPVTAHMHKALFAPESQQLESLATDMKMQNASLVVAVDEYGGAVGILTKEDILEEIVGSISDEFDDDSLTLMEMEDNTYLVNVKMRIDDINERLRLKLPKGDYETLAGFLLQQFNRIPSIGDELYYSNIKFRVHRASEKAIQTVIMDIIVDDDSNSSEASQS
jgi:putative hemolysin